MLPIWRIAALISSIRFLVCFWSMPFSFRNAAASEGVTWYSSQIWLIRSSFWFSSFSCMDASRKFSLSRSAICPESSSRLVKKVFCAALFSSFCAWSFCSCLPWSRPWSFVPAMRLSICRICASFSAMTSRLSRFFCPISFSSSLRFRISFSIRLRFCPANSSFCPAFASSRCSFSMRAFCCSSSALWTSCSFCHPRICSCSCASLFSDSFTASSICSFSRLICFNSPSNWADSSWSLVSSSLDSSRFSSIWRISMRAVFWET